MVAICSIVGVTLGAAIASLADRYPRHRERIETVAGILLLGGFGLLGYLLERIVGMP
jgi:hypothetical protein